MQAGKLDRRLLIEVNTPSQDAYGEPLASWGTLATVWAEKLTPRAYERYTGEQMQGLKSVGWRVRYRTDLAAANLMRVTENSVVYLVQGVIEVGRKEGHVLLTEAVL